MTATTNERRRNAYADHCYVCRKPVEAGAGWLYSDVKSQRSRSRHQAHGTWRKQVKCDRCHVEKISHKWQADNLDNPKPVEPTVRPWSVVQVRKWTLDLTTTTEGEVVLFVVGSFGRHQISHRESISGTFDAPTGYMLEEATIAGKPMSKGAAAELSPRILAIVNDVNRKEHEGGIAAAAELAAAGIEAVKHPHSTHWSIKMGGYVKLNCVPPVACLALELTLFGDAITGHRISGYDRRSGVSLWVTMSVKELIELVQAAR